MVGKLKQLSKNPIFSGLFIVSFSTSLVAFFNYYLNFLVQSLFPNFQQFGDYVFILTFLTVVLLVPNSLSGTLNLIVTELKVKNEFAKLTMLYIRMLVLFSLVGFVIGFLVFVTSSQLAEFFKVSQVFFIQVLALLIFLSIINIPVISFLYGLLKFKSFSLVQILGVVIKIIVTILFFNQGFGLESVLYGYLLGSIISFILGNLLLISSFDSNYKLTNVSEYTKKIILFSLPMFLIGIGSSFLGQIDFILVKNKFDTTTSGMYGYLVNLGKIFYFGSLILCGAMAPQITESLNKKENYFKIFFFYFKIVGLIIMLGLLMLGVFTSNFLELFINISKYVGLNSTSLSYYYQVIEYIPLYTVFIAIYILINFLTVFMVATFNLRIYVSYLVAISLQGLIIFTLAGDIYSTIYSNIIVTSLFLIYLIYETYKRFVSFNNSSNL